MRTRKASRFLQWMLPFLFCLRQRLLQQPVHVLHRDGVADPAGRGERGFLGAFHIHRIEHAQHFAGVGMPYGAAAVAGVGDGVEFEHLIRIFRLFQRAHVQLRGAGKRGKNGNDGGQSGAGWCAGGRWG